MNTFMSTFNVSQIPDDVKKVPPGWHCTDWKGFSARECKKCGETKLAFRHETVGSSTDTHLYCVACGNHDYR